MNEHEHECIYLIEMEALPSAWYILSIESNVEIYEPIHI